MIDIVASVEACKRQNAEGCVKTTEDLERYRAVGEIIRPDVVIECGTFSGKSARWFAREYGCQVITVDTDPHVDPDTRNDLQELGVATLIGSSTAPNIVRGIRKTVSDHGFAFPLLVLDSDHSCPHVMDELDAYADIAAYIVVEDGILRYLPFEEQKWYTGNPLDAIEAWLPNHLEWARDTHIEDMFPVTLHLSGWLQRTV